MEIRLVHYRWSIEIDLYVVFDITELPNLDFASLFLFFRCGSWREIRLLWDCMQLDYLPHRTARTIDGNRRRERKHMVRNRLDTSYFRSFRSRRLSWSLPDNSCSFSHLYTGLVPSSFLSQNQEKKKKQENLVNRLDCARFKPVLS